MSAQLFVTTHQGLVLSACRLGSSEGVDISAGLCRLNRCLRGRQAREEPGLPAFAEWGAWLDLSMLGYAIVDSCTRSLLDIEMELDECYQNVQSDESTVEMPLP